MPQPVVVIGIGELAGPFVRGLLRLGHPVYPVTRDTDQSTVASEVPGPALTLVTVREADLDDVLDSLPAPWRHAVGLVQNDLVPASWERHHLEPTVAVVWFEKKPRSPVKVIKPTVVGGTAADTVVAALAAVDIPAVVAASAGTLLTALVAKNLYIGVANLAGLAVPAGTTVGELWAAHRSLAEGVASEVLDLQEQLVAQQLDRDKLLKDMIDSFAADPDHGATGRTAPQRLQRALAQAAEFGVSVPTLQRIADTA
jgi:hypothetical protein